MEEQNLGAVAPAESAPALPQQIAPAVPSAPAEQTQTETSAGTDTPLAQATPEVTTPEQKEWDGNLESLKDLGKDEIERAKNMRRYLTKKTQEIGDAQKKAQEYDKLISDPRIKQALNGQPQAAPQEAPQQPQALWSPGEWEEAQVNPAKMAELFDRGVQARVNQVAAQYAPLIEQLQNKQTFVEKSQEIDEFARMHPDVWELYDAGIMKPLVREIVDSGQGTFAEAYEKAKSIESFYKRQATQEAQGRIMEKKAAVTATPSPTNEPSVIWASDREEAKKLAFENAILGKKVTVRTRQ